MTTLLTILVFLTVFVEVLLIAAFFRTGSGGKDVAKRLAAIMADVTEEAAADADAASVLVSREEPEGFKGRLTQTVKRVKADCDAFGWGKNLGVRIGLIALGSFLLAMAVGRMTAYPFLVTMSCGVLFFAVTCAVLYLRARQIWSADLAASLPEAIDSIARICRAGVPAQTAFGLAAQNLRGALATELATVDQWLKLGVPLKQVLQESATRVPVPDYRFFCVIVIISQESGGRLADTLERLASTLRDRAELALKVQAKTSEARASIKIVSCLVPGVLIYQYIQAPADFHFLVTDPTGLKVLFYAAASVAAGLLITWAMVCRIQ